MAQIFQPTMGDEPYF